jgi:hypothetical protein
MKTTCLILFMSAVLAAAAVLNATWRQTRTMVYQAMID